MTVATNALYTPGAIGNVTKRTGDIGQGLEPDEGQLSRPVLRGLVSGNTHRLPGHGSQGTPRACSSRRLRCSPVYSTQSGDHESTDQG